MKPEDKELLFKDLSARLPYHVRCKVWLKYGTTEEGPLDLEHNYGDVLRDAFYYNKIKEIKPYLRPMSSMTEEEREELKELTAADIVTNTGFGYKNLRGMCFGMMYLDCQEIINWLNKKMFDFRGLIPKDLAISTEVLNPYKD